MHSAHEGNLSEAQLTALIGGHDIVITSWGTPHVFPHGVLKAADRLKLIAHSAGYDQALVAAARHSPLAGASHTSPIPCRYQWPKRPWRLLLLCLRNYHKIDRRFKDHGWAAARELATPGGELAGNRVGVIGAGYTGRAVIRRSAGYGCRSLALRSLRQRRGRG